MTGGMGSKRWQMLFGAQVCFLIFSLYLTNRFLFLLATIPNGGAWVAHCNLSCIQLPQPSTTTATPPRHTRRQWRRGTVRDQEEREGQQGKRTSGMFWFSFLFSFYNINYFLRYKHSFPVIHHLFNGNGHTTSQQQRMPGKWEGRWRNTQETLDDVSWAYGMFILFFSFSFLFFNSTNYFLDTTHPFPNIHYLTTTMTHYDDKGSWEMRGVMRKRPRIS